MNKKGFTLIELLAVIVILSIILIIAVPIIFKTILISRYDSFKSNENMIKKSAQLYLTINTDLLPKEIGNKVSIFYTTLRDQKYITNIVDPINRTECNKSFVYVVKISDNEYDYLPALICDNYVSLDTFDLLKGEGKFKIDTNIDGLADGWGSYIYPGAEGSYVKSLLNNKQTVTRLGGVSGSAYLYVNKSISNIIPNNKYYAYVEFEELSNTRYSLQLCIDNYNPGFTNSTSDNEYDKVNGNMSIIHTVRPDTTHIVLFLRLMTRNAPAGDGTVKWKNAILINLTEMYGAGNEPTISFMDNIINYERTMH